MWGRCSLQGHIHIQSHTQAHAFVKERQQLCNSGCSAQLSAAHSHGHPHPPPGLVLRLQENLPHLSPHITETRGFHLQMLCSPLADASLTPKHVFECGEAFTWEGAKCRMGATFSMHFMPLSTCHLLWQCQRGDTKWLLPANQIVRLPPSSLPPKSLSMMYFGAFSQSMCTNISHFLMSFRKPFGHAFA